MPAWDKIWFFVIDAASEATSTSRIRELAAERFSWATLRFEMVMLARF